MPKYRRFKCTTRDGAAFGNCYVCWCDKYRAIALPVVSQSPPSMINRIITQIVVPQLYQDAQPAVFGQQRGTLNAISSYEGSMPRVLQMTAMGFSASAACGALTAAS
jgi:hypothetical protein